MPGYSIISDIGNGIIKLLKSHLVPDIIRNPDSIGLCGPDSRGDLSLGVYLYDVKESEEAAGDTGMKTVGRNTQKYPSTYLSLFYMITAYSSSDIKFRAAEEHRILGKTVQIFSDHSVLSTSLYQENGDIPDYPIHIEMMSMDNEEKRKTWNMPNLPYKLSLYYKVYPIEIESMKIRTVSRVGITDFTVKENKRRE